MSIRATIADLTEDVVIYRDLEACDLRLPRLATIRASLGHSDGPPPRKRDQAYAEVMQALADSAQQLRGGPTLTAFAVLGDTDNDRMLAAHLRIIGSRPAYGFIGEDRPVADEAMTWQGDTATATRWHLIHPWIAELEARGIDWARTALLIDIDKTLLGPRGRSDGAIDDARAEGALVIASQLVGETLDVSAFRRYYSELCRKEWHSYTLDNQDYVVATALWATLEAIELEPMLDAILHGTAPTISEIIAVATPRLPTSLASLQVELQARVAEGDPTPFKAFRRAELTATLDRMHDGRLTLCSDLFQVGEELARRGALCMAASDKPAESALPSAEQAAAGMLSLHHTPALVM